MMYGKHFASMYEGSMVGAGSHVFAVMGYVIAKQVPDREVGSQVRLNPELLSAILGEDVSRVCSAIEYLCSPDPKSNTLGNDGRRLIKIGQFDYQVVNGAMYRAIRNEEERRAQNREAKRRERARQKQVKSGIPLAGEMTFMKTGQELHEFQEVAVPTQGKTIEQAVKDARAEGPIKPGIVSPLDNADDVPF